MISVLEQVAVPGGQQQATKHATADADVFSKHGIRYHVYADDTQLYVDFPRNESALAIDRIRRCVIDVKAWLASRCLLLNEAKTETILFAAPNRMTQPSPLHMDICGSDVRTSANIRDLGVYLDSTMSMTKHVTRVCGIAYGRLRNIARVRSSLPLLACKTLVHALVTSTLDFGNAALFGITGTLYIDSRWCNEQQRVSSFVSTDGTIEA